MSSLGFVIDGSLHSSHGWRMVDSCLLAFMAYTLKASTRELMLSLNDDPCIRFVRSCKDFRPFWVSVNIDFGEAGSLNI